MAKKRAEKKEPKPYLSKVIGVRVTDEDYELLSILSEGNPVAYLRGHIEERLQPVKTVLKAKAEKEKELASV